MEVCLSPSCSNLAWRIEIDRIGRAPRLDVDGDDQRVIFNQVAIEQTRPAWPLIVPREFIEEPNGKETLLAVFDVPGPAAIIGFSFAPMGVGGAAVDPGNGPRSDQELRTSSQAARN